MGVLHSVRERWPLPFSSAVVAFLGHEAPALCPATGAAAPAGAMVPGLVFAAPGPSTCSECLDLALVGCTSRGVSPIVERWLSSKQGLLG